MRLAVSRVQVDVQQRDSVEVPTHTTRTNFSMTLPYHRQSFLAFKWVLSFALDAYYVVSPEPASHPLLLSSRLNFIHGPHIPTSRFVLHLSPSIITLMIPSDLEGQSVQTQRLVAPSFVTLRKSLGAYPSRN